MAGAEGAALREWRREQGWDVPEMARRLRHAAAEPLAEDLAGMIRRWERGYCAISERYELLYRKLGYQPPANGATVTAAEVTRRAQALPEPGTITAMATGAVTAGIADPEVIRAAAADAVAKVSRAREAMLRLAELLSQEDAGG